MLTLRIWLRRRQIQDFAVVLLRHAVPKLTLDSAVAKADKADSVLF
jgi:hypothetical protein